MLQMCNCGVNEEWQCACNVTLRRVRAAVVKMEKKLVLHVLSGVCSLSFRACRVHMPYCHLWPVQLYHILHIIS